jgi:hypothetical protein
MSSRKAGVLMEVPHAFRHVTEPLREMQNLLALHSTRALIWLTLEVQSLQIMPNTGCPRKKESKKSSHRFSPCLNTFLRDLDVKS